MSSRRKAARSSLPPDTAPPACLSSIAIGPRFRSRFSSKPSARPSKRRFAAARPRSRSDLLQCRTQRVGKRLVGAVEPERRDGDVTLAERREIGAFSGRIHHRGALEADPEIGIATTVLALVDPEEAQIALALPRHANAQHIFRRAGRE